MDLQIIGNFIKEQRKAKGLTQAQLAEKIFVSEKTISKWECGNGFPDTSLILPLCQTLEITANELLSGKKITNTDEYKNQAEQNILSLQLKIENSSKFLFKLEWIIGILVSVCLLSLVFIASFIEMATWLRISLIIFGFIVFIFGMHFALLIEQRVGLYECRKCGNKYIPTYNQVLWAPHYGRNRLMKCPKCNKKSYHKKVIK